LFIFFALPFSFSIVENSSSGKLGLVTNYISLGPIYDLWKTFPEEIHAVRVFFTEKLKKKKEPSVRKKKRAIYAG